MAVLGIALISMGEEMGAEMSTRSFEHMLQYGEVRLRGFGVREFASDVEVLSDSWRED